MKDMEKFKPLTENEEERIKLSLKHGIIPERPLTLYGKLYFFLKFFCKEGMN